MKRFKFVYKFLAFLLIFSLLLPAGLAQASEGNTSGHEDRDTGSLTIHKFEREPDAEGDGEEGDGSEGQGVPKDAKPVEGVEFTITQTHSYDPETDEWTALTGGGLTEVGSTDANGLFSFEDLPLGRYTVEETDAPAHINKYEGEIIVDLPMTGADGSTVIYDVHIYPKNETIRGAVELIKVDGATEEPLAGVVFELFHEGDSLGQYTTGSDGEIRVSGLAYGQYYFKEIASLDGYVLGDQEIDFSITESGRIAEDGSHEGTVVKLEAMNYVEPEIEKEVDESAVNRGEIVTYTLTIDLPADIASYNHFVVTDLLDDRLSYVDGSSDVSVPAAFEFAQNGQNLSWTVTDFAALEGVDQVSISFQALVAEDAEPNEVINNKAYIDFENQHGQGGEKETGDTPLNPTAGNITVIKRDGDDHKINLDGAVFELQDEDGNVLRTETTDSAGRILFDDVDYGSYYLVETKAPKGYNLLRKPIKVVVDAENHDVTVNVDNYKSDWHLPRTGGIGSIPFTILGLMIMGSAVYLYIRRRKQLA